MKTKRKNRVKLKSFFGRVLRRAITVLGGGMALGGDGGTALAGIGLVVLELAGRELMEWSRERAAKELAAMQDELKMGGSL